MQNTISTLVKETDAFVLMYRYNPAKKRPEFLMRSKIGGKHFAVHTRCSLLAEDGSMLESRHITPEVAQFIMDHFEERGDTASFDIYKTDLEARRLLPRNHPEARPNEVRHQLTDAEHSFTATGAKLAYHWPIFDKYRDTGYGSIIRATMTLHQVCSSHCQYCSTIARNRKDSTTLDEAKAFVNALYHEQAAYNHERFPEYNEKYRNVAGTDIRLRGLILSGGGQPNLWPHFEELVDWLGELDIDLGLITNGFPRKIREDIYSKFKWVRISITPEDASPHYVDGKFNLQYIPDVIKHHPDITVGYSYVYGPWTDDDILVRIQESIEENGFEYCRMLTDCNLTRSAQLRAHQALAERLFSLGFSDENGKPTAKIFHQLKYHGTPEEAVELWDGGQCFLQIYNVFWDTTGHEEKGSSYCYACDSITVLAEELTENYVSASERKFNHEKWGTVPNTEVSKLFTEPVRAYFDPREVCSSCLFMRNNRTVKELVANRDLSQLDLGPSLQHINFP